MMISPPCPTPRTRRAYDHRLREHVVRSGARSLARYVPIPRSSISTWQRRGLRPVVTIEPVDQDRRYLLESIVKLDCRARVLAAVVRLLLVLLRVSGFSLAGRRLPEGAAKADVLRTVESAQAILPVVCRNSIASTPAIMHPQLTLAACADIPENSVRKSGIRRIIRFFVPELRRVTLQ